ncbi:MAG TPA: HAMP domain-containing sensor histidine kinase [Cellvibrionaceae bacterium]
MTLPTASVDFSLVLAASVHDMKNSIGMLIGSLEQVIEELPPVNDVQAQHFNTLQYEASRINSELVQLLTIYRMQNDLLPFRQDQHYVLDVLEDQIARNHVLIENRHIALHLDCSDNFTWVFDADLVGSVVQNIIVNCCRYTRNRLLVAAQKHDDMLCITVADDGGGYPEAMLDSPANQVKDGDVTAGTTHLGLYFAEQIAALHSQFNRRGYIRLHNGEPYGGGVFKIYLP